LGICYFLLKNLSLEFFEAIASFLIIFSVKKFEKVIKEKYFWTSEEIKLNLKREKIKY
jgi:hypothetical protein